MTADTVRKKILMVDDEAAILLFYKAELADEGYSVVTASNGEKAMDLFDREKPDLVTLDIAMPEIRDGRLKSTADPVGIQLLKYMKSEDSTVPVIMLTAYDFTEQMKNLPSDGYVMKSTDTDELKAIIRKLVPLTNRN